MERRREDIAWAAGIFEGEGTITVRNGAGHRVGIAVAMTDEDVLQRFCAIVGFGVVRPKWIAPDRGWKPQHQWASWNFEGVQALIAMFWPWLGQRRRARAVELLRAVRINACRTCGGPLTNGRKGKRATRYCPACFRRAASLGGKATTKKGE